MAREIDLHVRTFYEYTFSPIHLDLMDGINSDRAFKGDIVTFFLHDEIKDEIEENAPYGVTDLIASISRPHRPRSLAERYRSYMKKYGDISPKADRVMNIEIDGVENHSSKHEIAQNKLRDAALKEKLRCPVKRITAYLSTAPETDSELLSEIESFYFKNVTNLAI